MMMNKTLPNWLCTYADFETVLPVYLDRLKVFEMSKAQTFPQYLRPSDRKSEPIFRRADILNWIRDTYFDFFPDQVAEVEASDFATNIKKATPNAK
jgi:hypothetical protein